MLVVQPGLDLLEPGRLEASPGRLHVRVVLVVGPALEVTAETFFLHDLSRRPRRAGDVTRAPGGEKRSGPPPPPRGSPAKRLRAASTMASEASTASTEPSGNLSNNNS